MTAMKIALGYLTYLPRCRREEALEHLTRSRTMPLAGLFDLWDRYYPVIISLLFVPP